MSGLPYNTDIPFETNTPAHDQPLMKANTNSIATWTGVDHFDFFSPYYGKHQSVTFKDLSNPSDPTLQTKIFTTKFGSATSYLEPYVDITESNSNVIHGYLPIIKSMAQFIVPSLASPIGTVCTLSSPNTLILNVASVVVNFNSGNGAWLFQVNFPPTGNLAYATYYVFNFGFTVRPVAVFSITSRTVSQFVISASNFAPNDVIGFVVI